MTRRTCIILVIVTAAFLSGAHGQTAKAILNILNPAKSPASARPQSAADQVPWVEQQLADLKPLVEKYQTTEFAAQILAAGLPATTQDDLLDNLHEAIHSYETSLETLAGVTSGEKALASPIPQPDMPVPGSQGEATGLRTGISKASAILQNTEADEKLVQSLCTQAASSADIAQQEYDRATERQQAASEEPEKSKAATMLVVAGSQLRSVNAQLYLYRWRVYWDQLTAAVLQNYITACRAAIAASPFDLSLDKTDIENRIATLKAQRESISPCIKTAIEQRTKLEAAYQSAMTARTAIPAQPDGTVNTSDPQVIALDQQLKISKEASNTASDLVDGLQILSALYGAEIKSWQSARALRTDHSIDLLQRLRDESATSRDVFAKGEPLIQRKLQSIRDQQDRFKETLAGLQGRDSSLKTLCQTGLKITALRFENLNQTLEELDTLQDINSRLFTRTSGMLLQESWRVRLKADLQGIRASMADGWFFTLVDLGNGKTITVSKVVRACGGLILSLVLAKFLSGLAGGLVRSKLRVGLARGAFIEKWVNYLLTIAFILFVLNWLSIPLTVFAFLGGALAIGIGFGAQNLVNNFISGIILLLEHHIKVGDLVVVDGNQGHVTHLGGRFSSIRKADGVELLVPNSYLLEKTVINWTLSDPKHRYDFTVGVAYGTDTAFAIKLFMQALEEQEGVLGDPPPKVYFEQFGDSALIFRLYYWLAVDNADTLQVGSDIRLRIDRDCRAAKIEIAYPQLDVHLHTTKPLGLQIERQPTAPDSSGRQAGT